MARVSRGLVRPLYSHLVVSLLSALLTKRGEESWSQSWNDFWRDFEGSPKVAAIQGLMASIAAGFVIIVPVGILAALGVPWQATRVLIFFTWGVVAWWVIVSVAAPARKGRYTGWGLLMSWFPEVVLFAGAIVLARVV